MSTLSWKLSLSVLSIAITASLWWQLRPVGDDGNKTKNLTDWYLKDHYWTDDHVNDSNVTQISIRISKVAIKDLEHRLANSRFTPSFTPNNFKYGFHSQSLQRALDFWINKYKWRHIEEGMNAFNHFKTKLEGLHVHFVHIKPIATSAATKVVPILLIHGWPSTFFEFFRLIALLDGNGQAAFELIVPSVPGTAFSAASSKQGLNFGHVGRILVKLMDRLGHRKFYVITSGFGSFVGKAIATLYPSRVLGLYTNFPIVGRSCSNLFKLIMANFLPTIMFDRPITDSAKIRPIFNKLLLFQLGIETSYLELDNLKPDTLGISLTDSPAGLVAYVLEKFAVNSDKAAQLEEDGGLGDKFNDKDITTQVMIFWLTSSMPSALRLIHESFAATAHNFNYYE